jgi:hypothetical protein
MTKSDKGRAVPEPPEGIETFDPYMRDPFEQPLWPKPDRGWHGWLTRDALQHRYRERWTSGLWDVHLYEHPGLARVWCVAAFRDGVEQNKITAALSRAPVVDHDHETLTDARRCFADWARHAAVDTALTAFEINPV